MKKAISVLLAFIIVVSAIPVCGAIDVSTKAEVLNLSDDVFYTDLFSVYSGYMSKNTFLDTMNTETQGVLIETYNTFKESDQYENMLVATAFDKTGIVDVLKLLGDGFGVTNFTYNEALDEANERFLNCMFGSQATSDTFGASARVFSYMQDFYDIIVDVAKQKGVRVEEIEALEIDDLIGWIDESTWIDTKYVDETVIREVHKYSFENLDKIKTLFDVGTQGIVILKAIYLACIIEMIRADIIDDLLESATEGTAFYDGMVRLKAQMGNNVADYVIRYYFDNGLLKKLEGAAEDWAIGLLPGSVGTTYNVITLTLKVASFVIFDLILDTPEFSEVTSFIILGRYASDLYTCIRTMDNSFSNTCLASNTITRYENLWCIYMAVNKAAWALGKDIAEGDTLDSLNFVYEIYFAGDHDLYSAHIGYIIETIEKVPVEERTITSVDCYNYNYSSLEYKQFGNSSDKIEKDTIYGVNNKLYGNMHVNQRQMSSVNGDRSVLDGILGIWGDLTVNGQTLTVPEGTELVVGGDVLLTGYWSAGSHYEGCLSIFGKATVLGDIYTDTDYTQYSFSMSDDGELWLYGDFGVGTYVYNYGTIYCVGEEKQNINGEITNLVVYNPEGITGTIKLSGLFDLQSNPFDGTVNLQNGGTFADGSNYNRVYINSNCTMKSNIPADTVEIYGKTLTVPEESQYTIDGDVILSGYLQGTSVYKGTLDIKGDLTVTGDISNVVDNYYYSITMTDSDAVLRLMGDQNIGLSSNYYGTVIFCGEETQKMAGAHNNITVTNPAGVTGGTTLYGHFDLCGNPFDGTVNLKNGGTLADGSNYNRVYINSDCTMNSNIPADTVEIYASTLTVPADGVYTIDGDVILSGYLYGTTIKKGTLDIKGDLGIGGDVYSLNNYYNIITYNGSTIRFTGNEEQRISGLYTAYTIELENGSEEGVIFENYITVNTLFDHNRNAYTFAGGASLPDYDGDGLSDEEDPVPEAVVGDVNIDGSLNSLDSNAMARVVAGISNGELVEEKMILADLNGDGSVNAIDNNMMKRLMAGA